MARYGAKFGDPASKKNKHLKHRVCKIDGIRGVVVPGDTGVQPFRIEVKTTTGIEYEQEEDLGSSGGEQELAEERFTALSDKAAQEYAELATGAMASLLEECALAPGEAAEPAPKKKNRKKMMPSAKKTFSLFGGLVESGDEDDAASDVECGSGRKFARSGNTSAAGRSRASSAGKERKVTMDKAPEDALVAKDAIEVESGDAGKRGAPKKDPKSVADQYWQHFVTGDMHVHFFGRRNQVLRRLLGRWLNNVKTKVRTANGAANADILLTQKKLELMDLSCFIVANWRNRPSMEAGVAKAESEFELLMTIANQEPVLQPTSEHLWDIYYDIQSNRSLDPSLKVDMARELSSDVLKLRYPPNHDYVATQQRFCQQWCANAMSKTTSAKMAKQAIGRLCNGVMDPGMLASFGPQLQDSASIWQQITNAKALTLQPAELSSLQDAVRIVESPDRCIGTVLAPLHEFPSLGRVLIDELKESCEKLTRYNAWFGQLSCNVLYTGASQLTTLPSEQSLSDVGKLVLYFEGASAAFAEALAVEKPEVMDKVREAVAQVVCCASVRKGLATEFVSCVRGVLGSDAAALAPKLVDMQKAIDFTKSTLDVNTIDSFAELSYWSKAAAAGDLARALDGSAKQETRKAGRSMHHTFAVMHRRIH
jgi:hypothetical protein